MEAAGWQVARQCSAPTYVVCGRGNNGGDGLASARHLHRRGLLVGVACTDPDSLSGPGAEEAQVLTSLGIVIAGDPDPGDATFVVDALLGTGLSRPPEGNVAAWIESINSWGRKVVSVDLPSGLSADTGAAPGACVTAALTVTLGLPKPGLLREHGPTCAGEVCVADIGVPFEAYAAAGVDVPRDLFKASDLIAISKPSPPG
jgi:hydroxyethylthiazole kinase-like uncharacterized protein yjeF